MLILTFLNIAESLDLLESWVLELFSSVKKGPLVNPDGRTELPIWRVGKLYWLEAVKDVHILDLSWTLPSLRKGYLKKAEDYLAHLLGHGKFYQRCYQLFFWLHNKDILHCTLLCIIIVYWLASLLFILLFSGCKFC